MGMDADELGLEGIVPDGDEEPEPEPSEEVVLLTEIRDLMKVEAERPKVRARIVTQPSSPK
jgi:hypothetical protein